MSPLIIFAMISVGPSQEWHWEEPLSSGGPIVRVTVRRVEAGSNWHYTIHLKSIDGLDQTIHVRSGQALGRADVRLVGLNADGFLDLMIVGGKDHRGQAWFKTWIYDPKAKAFKWLTQPSSPPVGGRMKSSEILAASIVLGILWAPTAGAQEPVFFSARDSVRIAGYFYSVRAAPKGLILAFHQGDANAQGEYRHIAPRLTAHGYAVLAVDLRAGGELFQDRNQTVAVLGASRPFCEAARDVEAAVAYAKANYPGLPIILWGSSYSAALVIRFVAEDGRGIAAILAFSPASGERMTGCRAEDVSEQVRIPVLVLRPAAEAARPPGAAQLATFRGQGHAVYVATPGTHGASMLDPARVEGNVAPTWEAVMGFLARVADP